MTKEKIKLVLHHNYLSIKVNNEKELQLPVRCAKIIKDMYNARNADNEKRDIEKYSQEGFANPEYEISVFIMNANIDSCLQWITKKIEPIKIK